MRKIGVFGGSFNPPHNGHISIVRQISALYCFDKVIVIPANIPPHKKIDGKVDAQQRLEMCKLAFTDNYMVVSDIEIRRKGISYTYDTLAALGKERDEQIYLIIGSDMLMNFDSWYRYMDILKLVKVITACRTNDIRELGQLKKKAGELNMISREAITVCQIKAIEISSAEIKSKARNNEEIGAFVPEPIKKYIIERGLYND